jgi:hypothetical protein
VAFSRCYRLLQENEICMTVEQAGFQHLQLISLYIATNEASYLSALFITEKILPSFLHNK